GLRPPLRPESCRPGRPRGRGPRSGPGPEPDPPRGGRRVRRHRACVRPVAHEGPAASPSSGLASAPSRKAEILRELLLRADPRTAKSIVKVLGGELRIGLREGLVEAAIAKAFDRPIDEVKWAGMLTGDVGRLAALARDDRLDEAELALFHPLKFMLASPAEDAAEIVRR